MSLITHGYFCSEPKRIEALSFDGLTERLSSLFKDKRFGDFRRMAKVVRSAVREAASPASLQMEDAIAGRLRQLLPPEAADGDGGQPERAEAILDVLVAREIARIDLGIDLVIAQPR